MPASTRKGADAVPAAGESVPAAAQPEAAVAAEAAASAPSEPEDAPRPAVDVVFAGQAQSFVAGVGLCDPGVSYPVRAALADELCGGDSPPFTRAAA